MRSWTILATVAVLSSLTHGALYPWFPVAPPWWVRAPDKDLPASVNLQQVGGSYSLSTVEGKAYQAVAPSAAIQPPPPVTAVHVQAVPSVAIRYLPTGQAVLVPAVAAVNPGNAPEQPQASGADEPEAAAEGEGEPATEPREPAPVTEQPDEEDEVTESQ